MNLLKPMMAGAALLAAGVALAIGAAREARRAPVPPFGYGLIAGGRYVEPAGAAADGARLTTRAAQTRRRNAPGPCFAGPRAGRVGVLAAGNGAAETAPAAPSEAAGPGDLEATEGPLGPEDLQAIRQALDPLSPGPALPFRILRGLLHVPADGVGVPGLVPLAVVADADADAVLVPLAGPADAYLGFDGPLADLLRGYDFPAGAADVRTARLPASARLLRGIVLVRASAAGRLGLKPKAAEPNRAAVPLAAPGALEAAWGRALALEKERGLRFAPVDLEMAADSAARWMGLAALGLMVAGGSAGGLAALRRLGGVRPSQGLVGEYLVRGAGLVAGHWRAYAATLAALGAALMIGAAWGAPLLRGGLMGPAVGQEQPTLSMIGLSGARPGPLALFMALLWTAAGNFVVRAVLLIGMPALVPGLGPAAAIGQALVWGAGLAPTTATLLERLPLRAAVAAVEVHAYAAMALGAWRVLVGVARPRALGQERRRAGYAAGAADLYAVLPLAGAILLAAALLETVLVAVVGWSG